MKIKALRDKYINGEFRASQRRNVSRKMHANINRARRVRYVSHPQRSNAFLFVIATNVSPLPGSLYGQWTINYEPFIPQDVSRAPYIGAVTKQ